MLLTSTLLPHSPAIQSMKTSTRSATNLTLQQIFKEKKSIFYFLGIEQNYKKINKHNRKIANGKQDVIVTPTQTVKIKIASPIPTNLFESIHT
ncbi:unnamed protein product [Rotaria sordida]|uniref:Uncharacterized protein n=1 Tax=Rotaria sordida TaxID=392033 RepID=A0A815XYV9_9BILA|nr:unnamed protein product [Rotaria sordida]